MLHDGYVTMDNGMVRLADKGFQLLHQYEEES